MTTTFITENLPDFVNISIPKTSSLPYTIYNLSDKFDGESNTNNNIYNYRSVIVGDEKLLCMAPSKSVSIEKFKQLVGDNHSSIKYEEFVEGTMINLFWDDRVGWEIATRKSIGCNYFYFRNQYDGIEGGEQKTFKQMFLDAFGANSIADIQVLSLLDKSCCYTFVVQHPLNHIVLNITNPVIYLVHSYKFDGMNYQYCENQNPDLCNYGIKFPERINDKVNIFSESDDRSNYFVDPSSAGIMITHLTSGLRTVIRNPQYEELKTRRGNNPNLFYQYLMLRKKNECDKFLQHFPQYSKHFIHFQSKFTEFVTTIYQMYVDIHILKIKNTKSIPKAFLYFVEKLHYTVYLPSLKTTKVKITTAVIEKLLDSDEYMMPMKPM